jgi:hypothetical protein
VTDLLLSEMIEGVKKSSLDMSKRDRDGENYV